MTLLVRNEEDIIADNIKYHSQVGVDAFVVLDNASDDSTPDVVKSLQDDFEIDLLFEPEKTYQQRQWVTKIAFHAKDKLGADWVFSNDADEFWVPKSGSLKTGLDRKGSIIRCSRYNMMVSREVVESNGPYYDYVLRMNNPIQWVNESNEFLKAMATYLREVPENVAVNAHGLIKMLSGNHSAWHIARAFNRRWSENISIYHYPIRAYERFEKKIADRRQLLRTPGARKKLGGRYDEWVDLFEKGKLREEYEQFLLSDQDVLVLKKFGVLQVDTTGKDAIERVLEGR